MAENADALKPITSKTSKEDEKPEDEIKPSTSKISKDVTLQPSTSKSSKDDPSKINISKGSLKITAEVGELEKTDADTHGEQDEEIVIVKRGPIDYAELNKKYEPCEEEVIRNRRPPNADGLFSGLFYARGPLGPQQRRLTFSEKMQGTFYFQICVLLNDL